MGVTVAPKSQPLFRNLLPGDPAPWFKQRSTSNPNYDTGGEVVFRRIWASMRRMISGIQDPSRSP